MHQPAPYPTSAATPQGNYAQPSFPPGTTNVQGLQDDPETAAVNAHLENWAEAEAKRRKSVRHARRAEAFEEVTNMGPMRRMSTRRRRANQAQHDEQPPSPSAAPDTSDAVPNTGAQATPQYPSMSTPPPAAMPPPGMGTRMNSSPPGPARMGDHREIDMVRKAPKRPGSNLGPNGAAAQPQNGNKPNPTGARPIVTAGPAPVRAMWAKEAAEAPPANAQAEEEMQKAEGAPEKPAQEKKSKKRSFWLTDLLCCNFGSGHDDEQAAKTNPNE